jgi:hypothetical protein
MNKFLSDAERFWPKVQRGEPDECWPWLAMKEDRMGYGRFHMHGYMVGAHRAAWELTYGPIPDRLCVLHHCDNASCVNPAHLWLGTKGDNNVDRSLKSRSGRVVGEAHVRACVSENDVRDIRRLTDDGCSRRRLADIFGISVAQVQRIVHRESWSHVA